MDARCGPDKQTMKQKLTGFPNRADFMYWTLRQPTPKWTREFKLPIICDIDGVVNSHTASLKDGRDPHHYVSGVLSVFASIKRSEGRYAPKGELMNRLKEFARRSYNARTKGNYTREAFYGIFARRCLRKLNRQKPTDYQQRYR